MKYIVIAANITFPEPNHPSTTPTPRAAPPLRAPTDRVPSYASFGFPDALSSAPSSVNRARASSPASPSFRPNPRHDRPPFASPPHFTYPMARRYPPIVTFTPAIARTATSASVPGSIPDARVCRTIAEAGMVPVRIDPTRPDPPHRLNRTDRSIDIDRYRSTRSMLGFNACTIRASASPIEWNRCTDTHRSIAPISIGTHRYSSIDRSIATATAGTRGARLTWMECADSRR